MQDSSRHFKTISALQAQEVFPIPGNKIFIVSASAPFGLQFDNGNVNVAAAGMEFEREAFRHVTIKNLGTVDLKVAFFVGTARVKFNFPYDPATTIRPSAGAFAGIGFANRVSFPGIAGSALVPYDATYSDYGIAEGNRRQQFVVSNPDNTDIVIGRLGAGDTDKPFARVSGDGTTVGHYTLNTDNDFYIYQRTAGSGNNNYLVAEKFYL